jgi:hypothetical protein
VVRGLVDFAAAGERGRGKSIVKGLSCDAQGCFLWVLGTAAVTWLPLDLLSRIAA